MPQHTARHDRVMRMYDIGDGSDVTQPGHHRNSGLFDVVRGDACYLRVDSALVARPQQLERQVAHIDRGTGPGIERDVCNQNSHGLSIYLDYPLGWKSCGRALVESARESSDPATARAIGMK